MSLNDNPPTRRSLHAQQTPQPLPATQPAQPIRADHIAPQQLPAQSLPAAQPAQQRQAAEHAQPTPATQPRQAAARTLPAGRAIEPQPVALLQPKRLSTLGDDQYEFLRTPKMRKKIVIALVASMLLSGLLIALSPVLNTAIFVVLLLVVTVAIMTSLGGLSIANRGIGEYGADFLDERQHSLGNSAYKTAYKLLGVTVALVISAMFVLNMTDLAIPPSAVGGMLVVLWEAIFALPAIAVALTLKD